MSGFAYQIILLVILWLSIGMPTEIGWHRSVISSWQWEALGPMSPILDVFWYFHWLGDLRFPFDFLGSQGCCLTAFQKWWHLFFGRNGRGLYMSFIIIFLCHLFLTAYSIELESFVLLFSIKQERGCNGISRGFKNRATWQNPILLLNNLIILYTAWASVSSSLKWE